MRFLSFIVIPFKRQVGYFRNFRLQQGYHHDKPFVTDIIHTIFMLMQHNCKVSIIHCCYQIERPPEYKVKSYTQVGYANAKLMTQI